MHVFFANDSLLPKEVDDFDALITDAANDCRMELLKLDFQHRVRLYNDLILVAIMQVLPIVINQISSSYECQYVISVSFAVL